MCSCTHIYSCVQWRNETVRNDDAHQIQVSAGQHKIQGAVIHYAREQANHEVLE